MDDYAYCQVATTTGARAEADRLARGAVEARVAACAQVVGPVGSVYRWREAIETAEGWRGGRRLTAHPERLLPGNSRKIVSSGSTAAVNADMTSDAGKEVSPCLRSQSETSTPN